MTYSNSILPPNSGRAERALELAIKAMKPNLKPLLNLYDAWNCPEPVLPFLAWAWSVDEWNDNWSLQRRRQVVAKSIAIHRIKGSKPSIIAALSSMGFNIDFNEWFDFIEGQNSPKIFSFQLDAFGEDVIASGGQIDTRLYNRVKRAIEHVKPARAHFDFRIGESFKDKTTIRTGAREKFITRETNQPTARPHECNSTQALNSGVRQTILDRVNVAPKPRAQIILSALANRAGSRAKVITKVVHNFERSGAYA